MNRREFLQAGAAPGLALSVAGTPGLGRGIRPHRKTKRVGLIGCGWYGKCDLFRLIQVAPVEVVSLCDVDKKMLAEAADLVATRQASKKKPRTYGDYREMLKEKDLDIVLVATPDHWHALPMIAAVEAGADVYVQKPISVDVVEGQAMLAAARKHKRVVQVGTQRRSTPHLIEARDRIIKRGQARQDRPRRDLLLLPHAGQRQPAGHARRPTTSTTRCGPARPRCGRTTRSSTRAAGGRSWSTATASSATCASTCSTWSAGCSTSAGRSGSARPAASSCRRTARRTSPTPRRRRSTSATCTVVWQHRTWGDAARPEVPLGRDLLRRQGHAQGERQRATTSSRWAAGKPIHRDVAFELEQYPEDKTEKDLEQHVAPAIRGHMLDFLDGDRRPRQAGRRHRAGPHLDGELHPGQPGHAARPDADLGPEGATRSSATRRRTGCWHGPIAGPGCTRCRRRS